MKINLKSRKLWDWVVLISLVMAVGYFYHRITYGAVRGDGIPVEVHYFDTVFVNGEVSSPEVRKEISNKEFSDLIARVFAEEMKNKYSDVDLKITGSKPRAKSQNFIEFHGLIKDHQTENGTRKGPVYVGEVVAHIGYKEKRERVVMPLIGNWFEYEAGESKEVLTNIVEKNFFPGFRDKIFFSKEVGYKNTGGPAGISIRK